MPRMKGAEIITEYLIDNGIPYLFGICGHGNVGMPRIWRMLIFAYDTSR